MTKVQHFSGIDISKSSFDVCIEQDGQFKIKKFAYTDEGMNHCLTFLPSGSCCIIEATGTYHCRLAYFLHEKGIAVSIVNPLSVKRYSQALMLRTKTDRADSRMLAAYGKTFSPEPWQPKKEYCVELQQLIGLQQQMIKQQTAIVNQQEAIAHSVVKNSLVQDMLQEQEKQVKTHLATVEEHMERLIREHDGETYENLCSIAGIGRKTAIVLIALTQNMEAFDSARQVSSYFGLCPRIYESGSSVKGSGKICKMGMALIRKLLYMCALSARKYNKACREMYERLIARGKSKKLILIAIANKLLKQAFAIIKNKTPYNDNFLSFKFAN